VERVIADGYRYLIMIDSEPKALDLYVLCRILATAKFTPAFLQAEVWIGSRPAAYFYYKLRHEGYYVGPSRRYVDGKWTIFGKRYYVRREGAAYVLTDGKEKCVAR